MPPKAWVIFTSHIALWKLPATCGRPKKLVYNSYLPGLSKAFDLSSTSLDFCSMYEFRALKLPTRDTSRSPRNFLICPVLPGGKVLCIWSQKQGFLRLSGESQRSIYKETLWPDLKDCSDEGDSAADGPAGGAESQARGWGGFGRECGCPRTGSPWVPAATSDKSKGEIPAQPPARKEPTGLGRSNDLSREEAKCQVGEHQARCDDQPYFHIHMNLWVL